MTVYRMISAEKAEGFPVSLMCELLGVSRSGYHDWARRAPSDRALEDAWLTEKITEIHQANRPGLRRAEGPRGAAAQARDPRRTQAG